MNAAKTHSLSDGIFLFLACCSVIAKSGVSWSVLCWIMSSVRRKKNTAVCSAEICLQFELVLPCYMWLLLVMKEVLSNMKEHENQEQYSVTGMKNDLCVYRIVLLRSTSVAATLVTYCFFAWHAIVSLLLWHAELVERKGAQTHTHTS